MPLLQLARTRRPRRTGEWTESKAVTFIVTLAASRSVTLAAACAGMSRKSAYALKFRDIGFAAAWNVALAQPALNSFQGDKVDEVDTPRSIKTQGDRTARPISASFEAQMRDKFFASLADPFSDSNSSMLARASALP